MAITNNLWEKKVMGAETVPRCNERTKLTADLSKMYTDIALNDK